MPVGRAAGTATAGGAVAEAAEAAALTVAAAGGAEAAAAVETHWDCWALEAGPDHVAGKSQVSEFMWCFVILGVFMFLNNLEDHCSAVESDY